MGERWSSEKPDMRVIYCIYLRIQTASDMRPLSATVKGMGWGGWKMIEGDVDEKARSAW